MNEITPIPIRLASKEARAFYGRVEAETLRARKLFQPPCPINWEQDHMPRVYGINNIVEEVGKLARAANKLIIADDPHIRDQWHHEARKSILQASSLLRRLEEVLDQLPDR